MIQKTVLLRKTFKASGAIPEGSLVKFVTDDDTVVICTGATDKIVGVASHVAADGERIEVDLVGVTYVVLGGSVARGDDVTADANGAGVALSAAATIKSSVGRAMASGAAADLCPVLVNLWSAVTA